MAISMDFDGKYAPRPDPSKCNHMFVKIQVGTAIGSKNKSISEHTYTYNYQCRRCGKELLDMQNIINIWQQNYKK